MTVRQRKPHRMMQIEIGIKWNKKHLKNTRIDEEQDAHRAEIRSGGKG
jgi:hypothetical protein